MFAYTQTSTLVDLNGPTSTTGFFRISAELSEAVARAVDRMLLELNRVFGPWAGEHLDAFVERIQSLKEQRRIQLREWSWAAIARRERELIRTRRPAPAAPPRPRRWRRRVTAAAERYRVFL